MQKACCGVKHYDLSTTQKVYETRRKLTANRKLALGWVLIGVIPLEKSVLYCLALPWPKKYLIEVV